MYTSIPQMIPITELADTLSFGLVGKIRKKAHVLEDDVQLMHEHRGSQDHSCTKAVLICKRNSSATSMPIANGMGLSPENENTITAAYSFNDSVIAKSMSRPFDDCSVASSATTLDGPLTRSMSLQHPPMFHRAAGSGSDSAERRQSVPRCAIAHSLDRDMHTIRKKASDTISSLTSNGSSRTTKTSLPKKVSISESATDLMSGTSFSIDTGSSRTLTSSKIPHPTAKSQYALPGNYRTTAYKVLQETDETEVSSVSSFNGMDGFRLVLDEHIIPGMPDVSTASPQLQDRVHEVFVAK